VNQDLDNYLNSLAGDSRNTAAGAGGYTKTTAGSFGISSAYLAFTITRFFIPFNILLYN
jgi:hypothetical protein